MDLKRLVDSNHPTIILLQENHAYGDLILEYLSSLLHRLDFVMIDVAGQSGGLIIG